VARLNLGTTPVGLYGHLSDDAARDAIARGSDALGLR
jgi:hypothetical protein